MPDCSRCSRNASNPRRGRRWVPTQALQELATRRDQLLEMRVAEQQRLKRSSAQVSRQFGLAISEWAGSDAEFTDEIPRRALKWIMRQGVIGGGV